MCHETPDVGVLVHVPDLQSKWCRIWEVRQRHVPDPVRVARVKELSAIHKGIFVPVSLSMLLSFVVCFDRPSSIDIRVVESIKDDCASF